MNEQHADDIRNMLAALVDPVVRAAQLLLVLDEDQPDALRAEAITMSAERLFWTLTQLDGGLDLDTCQAVVRADRLSRYSRPVPDRSGHAWQAAERAAGAAATWLRPRLATLPLATDLADWLDRADRAVLSPAPVPALTWLDTPPLVGLPLGTPAWGPMDWPLIGVVLTAALRWWWPGAPRASFGTGLNGEVVRHALHSERP